jgi:serine/threonine protein kinase
VSATDATLTFADGRYTVERLLGRGGMAAVYLAHDRELDRTVAVKVLDERFAADEEVAGRFRREALTAARLGHPNVVAVYDTGVEEGAEYIVMEHVEGEGLDDVLAREAPLAPERVIELAVQACAGLGYAHGQGVVHRDVKPANLLLRPDGLLKVTDFGIARSLDRATTLTQAGTILGTAAYLAPEQARGEEAGPPADVFSLGVVCYQALTGELPWRVESLAQLAAVAETPARPVRDLAPETPAAVESAVMHALAREPEYRPQDAAAFGAELEGAPTDVHIPSSQAETVALRAPQKRRRAARRRLPAIAAAVLAVAAVVAALAIGLASRGGGSDTPEQVGPVRSSTDPAGQARNLEAWIHDHTDGN